MPRKAQIQAIQEDVCRRSTRLKRKVDDGETKDSITKKRPTQKTKEVVEISQLPNEMLVRIFECLDVKELFKCRSVSNRWKDIANDLLWKDGKTSHFRNHTEMKMNYSENFQDRLDWFASNTRGTLFTSVDHMEAFLMEMQDFQGNPFPTRTVIIAVTEVIMLSNLSLEAQNRSGIVQRFEDRLTRFIARFGQEIFSCVVLFPRVDNRDELFSENMKRINVALFNAIFTMFNLRSLTLFNKQWLDVYGFNVRQTYLPTNLPHLAKLREVQVLGENAIYVFSHFLTGYAAQLENLRLGCSSRIDLPNSVSLSQVMPKGKRLALDEPCNGLILALLNSDTTLDLEEFSIAYNLNHEHCNEFVFGSLIGILDKIASKSLRTLTFHINTVHFRISNIILKSLLSDLQTVKYENVKEITISYRTIKHRPCLLPFFFEKCPNLQALNFHGLTNDFEQPNDVGKADFEKFCNNKWKKKFPKSLKKVSVPSLGFCATRPEEKVKKPRRARVRLPNVPAA